MSLELAPEIEEAVRAYAEAEGLSINDLLARHFLPQRVAADDPVLQFLNDRLRQAQIAAPAEQAQAEAEWEKFKQGMNENRRRNGENLLYPEDHRQ